MAHKQTHEGSGPAQSPSVHVQPRAGLTADDDALVTLRVTAPAGAEVLEAFIYLVQDGEQTAFTPFHPTGDEHPELITVRVPSDDLEVGDARVSGYFLLSTGQAVNIVGDVHLTPFRPAAHSAAAEGWVFG